MLVPARVTGAMRQIARLARRAIPAAGALGPALLALQPASAAESKGDAARRPYVTAPIRRVLRRRAGTER